MPGRSIPEPGLNLLRGLDVKQEDQSKDWSMDGQMGRRMGGQMDGQKFPCILQDFGDFRDTTRL